MRGNKCKQSSVSCTRSPDETTAAKTFMQRCNLTLSTSRSRTDDNFDAILDVRQQTWYGYLPTKPRSHSRVVQSKRIRVFFFFLPFLLLSGFKGKLQLSEFNCCSIDLNPKIWLRAIRPEFHQWEESVTLMVYVKQIKHLFGFKWIRFGCWHVNTRVFTHLIYILLLHWCVCVCVWWGALLFCHFAPHDGVFWDPEKTLWRTTFSGLRETLV